MERNRERRVQSYVYLSIYKKGAKEWQADKEVIAADNMDTVGRQGVEVDL